MPKDSRKDYGLVAYAANDRVEKKLNTKSVIKSLNLLLTGTLNTTLAGTAVDEHPATLIKDVSIELDGRGHRLIDGETLYLMNQLFYGKAGLKTISNGGIATVAAHAFKEDLHLDLAMPDWERNSWGFIDGANFDNIVLVVRWNDENKLVSGGTKAFTVNPSIRVLSHEIEGINFPDQWFFENSKQEYSDLAAANAAKEINLPKKGFFLRGVLVKAEDNDVVSDAIVNVLTVKGKVAGGTSQIIRDAVRWDQLQADNVIKYGMDVAPGYVFIDFAEDGRPGGVLDGNVYDDLFLSVDHNGGANYKLKIYPFVMTK